MAVCALKSAAVGIHAIVATFDSSWSGVAILVSVSVVSAICVTVVTCGKLLLGFVQMPPNLEHSCQGMCNVDCCDSAIVIAFGKLVSTWTTRGVEAHAVK